jgi:16S rRNA (cytidine1402-2'-O)-methyltransferase
MTFSKDYGTLYLCATPIGNLGDITQRVLDTLRSVDVIAAEDTRNTKKLLAHFDIHTPLTSYHEFNKFDKAEELIRELKEGRNIACVTDAGTPAISDPGEVLTRRCIEEGIRVTSLPGACALITALTLSGMKARRFVFEGFLPDDRTDRKERRRILSQLENEERTIILYEAPHHLKGTLSELMDHLGEERKITVCRELTKKFEEAVPETLGDAVRFYEENEPRGEYVLVIEGAEPGTAEKKKQEAWKSMTVPEHVALYEAQGLPRKDAMKKTAEDRGISRREIYAELLKDGNAGDHEK